jgi:hypothetical protein
MKIRDMPSMPFNMFGVILRRLPKQKKKWPSKKNSGIINPGVLLCLKLNLICILSPLLTIESTF